MVPQSPYARIPVVAVPSVQVYRVFCPYRTRTAWGSPVLHCFPALVHMAKDAVVQLRLQVEAVLLVFSRLSELKIWLVSPETNALTIRFQATGKPGRLERTIHQFLIQISFPLSLTHPLKSQCGNWYFLRGMKAGHSSNSLKLYCW